MKRQAIVFVAAGDQQLLPISVAKKIGFAVVAIDKNLEAVAFAVADEIINLSTYAAEPIIHKLKRLKESYNFRAVVTRSSGIPVVTTAAISKASGLRGVDIHGADSIIHKTKFARRCTECGIPAPENQSAASTKEIDWESIKYPAILKPSLGLVGQKGVFVVNNSTELLNKFDVALSAAYDNRVEIESYEEGDDVVLMAVVKDGNLKPVVLLDEMNKVDDCGEIHRVAFSMPSKYSGTESEKEIHKLSGQIIREFGIRNSPFLLSCKIREGALPAVIELHLDLGADKILDKLFPASTEFDFIRFALTCLTGGDISEFDPEDFTFKPCSVVYTPFHNEVAKDYEGINKDDSYGILPRKFSNDTLKFIC